MARTANSLDIQVVGSTITEVVVVFVPPLARLVDVTTVGTRQTVRARELTCPHQDVNPLPRLHLIAVPRRVRVRPILPRTRLRHILSPLPRPPTHPTPGITP